MNFRVSVNLHQYASFLNDGHLNWLVFQHCPSCWIVWCYCGRGFNSLMWRSAKDSSLADHTPTLLLSQRGRKWLMAPHNLRPVRLGLDVLPPKMEWKSDFESVWGSYCTDLTTSGYYVHSQCVGRCYCRGVLITGWVRATPISSTIIRQTACWQTPFSLAYAVIIYAVFLTSLHAGVGETVLPYHVTGDGATSVLFIVVIWPAQAVSSVVICYPWSYSV